MIYKPHFSFRFKSVSVRQVLSSILIFEHNGRSKLPHTSAGRSSVNIINALMQLPSLTKLLLHNFPGELVSQLQNLIYLEDLSLNLRSNLLPLNIFEILSTLQNLRSLHISNMNIMEARNSCFNELQDLEIVACHTYSMLPHVPKLKSLIFRRNLNYSPDFQLSNWISLHAYTLEFLELFLQHLKHTNFGFKEQDLLEMLKNFTNLRTLQLGNSMSCGFAWSFRDQLKAKGFSAERPFRLVLENCKDLNSLRSSYMELDYSRSSSPWGICTCRCLY